MALQWLIVTSKKYGTKPQPMDFLVVFPEFPEGFLQWISPHLAHVNTHLRLSSKLPSRVDHIYTRPKSR